MRQLLADVMFFPGVWAVKIKTEKKDAAPLAQSMPKQGTIVLQVVPSTF